MAGKGAEKQGAGTWKGGLPYRPPNDDGRNFLHSVHHDMRIRGAFVLIEAS